MASTTLGVPGFPTTELVVYGDKLATSLEQRMAQGFYVKCKGEPTARNMLSAREFEAVAMVLKQNFPQHYNNLW